MSSWAVRARLVSTLVGLAACAGLLSSACLERREPDGVAPRDECTTCHGGLLEAPFEAAPPTSLAGDSERSARGVGAHEAHLFGNDWARTIACTECHVVPETIDAKGHTDSDYPAEIIFKGVATAFEAEPYFDFETGRCRDTFCHGGSFVGHRPSGGLVVEPRWNSTDSNTTACNGCHGLPPPDPHPVTESCTDCHHNIDADLKFNRPERHVDGKVTFYVVD
jgi:predicted CxxxxCH...CXXCH cytochrome family protein